MSLEPPATGISGYLVVEEIMSGRVDLLAELRSAEHRPETAGMAGAEKI
jgi:hypothetical protein